MRIRTLCALAVAFLLVPLASAQQRRAAPDEAKVYLQNTAFRYGVSADDLTDLAVTDAYASRGTGITHVYLQQTLNGLPVVGAEFTVGLDRDGRVFHAAGRGAPVAGQRLSASPSVTAEAAAAAVARDAGLTPGAFAVLSSEGGQAPRYTLSDGGVAEEPVAARLVYRYGEEGALALSWEVGLYERGAQHYWLGYVDAGSGRVTERHDLVVHDYFGPSPDAEAGAAPDLAPTRAAAAEASAFAPLSMAGSYRVYPLPVESPNHTSPPPPADGRVLLANPDNASASPYGWHDTNGASGAEYTVTRGNNVEAYTDTDNNNSPDAGSEPDGGAGLVFDFPINLSGAPSGYRPAAVTNLFYINNTFHDVMWHYGFDEPAGNFQVNNYGHGGNGNDDVRAEAQDGGGINNANFFTPADGQRPRMQMYLWSFSSPQRDGDIDNGIIMHEYGHGVSNRLVGGPLNVNCLNNGEEMGEGWSDYFALMLTMRPTDNRSTRRGMGTYVLGQPTTGCGIRCPPFQSQGAPYAADFSINDFTYQDTRFLSEVHAAGFVWATALYEMTWDLIDAYGFDPDVYNADGTAGNQIALRLVTEALKLTPCSPGFVSGRDAILAADEALYNGAHVGLLWSALARRGLGVNANQGSTFTNGDNTEDFTVPNVKLTLTPSDPPVVVARGETMSYTARLAVGSGGPSSVQYWVEATFPDGHEQVVLGPKTVHVTPGTTVSRTLSQRIPGGAPLGDFLYTMKVGTYPGTVLSSGGFGLTVTAAAGVAARAADDEAKAWLTYDEHGALIPADADIAFFPVDDAATSEVATASALPATSALIAPYPNPFAGTATVAYEVAQAGEVHVAVYDVLGRELAVLADGRHEAGRYTAVLDGRSLPAGVYLVRMSAPGFSQTVRVTALQ